MAQQDWIVTKYTVTPNGIGSSLTPSEAMKIAKAGDVFDFNGTFRSTVYANQDKFILKMMMLYLISITASSFTKDIYYLDPALIGFRGVEYNPDTVECWPLDNGGPR